MSQQLKLVISDGQKVLETISKETLDTHPATMVKAVNDFRLLVNTAMTKLIIDDTCDLEEEEECIGDDNEKDTEVSPKKRKR